MDERPAPLEDIRYRGVIALAVVGMAICYTMLAASSTLWDRDEPRFARAAVEMVQSGDYLVPRFNHNLRPDKPALVYWAMSVPLRLIDNDTLAVRIPSIVGMICTCVMTFVIGRMMFGLRVGLWAMGMMATALNAVVIGTAATADGTLMAWIMLAIWSYLLMIYRGAKPWHWVVFTLALGGAQLTKGPVGLAVPMLAVAGSAWFGRGGAIRITRKMWIGFAIAVVISFGIFAAWAVPANNATGGEFAKLGLGKHVLDRAVKPAEGHGLSGILGYLGMTIGFYPIILIAGFFPWTLMLPAAISAFIRKHLCEKRERAILIGWALPTFVMMSLVATKLPHYILPIYPALAIASAQVMARHRQGALSDKDRDWLRGGVWFFIPLIVVLLGGVIACGVMFTGSGSALPIGVVGAAILVIGVLAVREQLAERIGRSARVAMVGVAAGVLLASRLLMPTLETSLKISPEIAALVNEHAADDVPVFWCGYEEPSLVFYMNRPFNKPVQNLKGSLEQWLEGTGNAVLVVTEEQLEKVNQPLPGTVERVGQFSAIKYASGQKPLTVVVLRRYL